MTTNYLLDAVDRLTLNHVTKVLQTKTVGELEIACISDVDHEPLLRMLRDAVAGGTGAHNTSGIGSERIPLNSGALELWDEMVKRINTWYRTVPNHREETHIWDRLRQWYVDFENRRRAGKITDTEEHDALQTVEGWARSIENMFDPPIVLELTKEHWEPVMIPKTRVRIINGERIKEPIYDHQNEPVMTRKLDALKRPVSRLIKTEPAECPLCGQKYAYDPKTGDQITALIIEYRNIGAETLDKATGMCRSCATVWHGRSALRELRFDIELRERVEQVTA